MLVRLPLDNPEAVWAAMQQRLIAGDVDGAVLCFSALSGDSYREVYLSITRQELSAIIGHSSDSASDANARRVAVSF